MLQFSFSSTLSITILIISPKFALAAALNDKSSLKALRSNLCMESFLCPVDNASYIDDVH